MLTREQREAHQRMIEAARERSAIRTHAAREVPQVERARDAELSRVRMEAANARWGKSRGDAR